MVLKNETTIAFLWNLFERFSNQDIVSSFLVVWFGMVYESPDIISFKGVWDLCQKVNIFWYFVSTANLIKVCHISEILTYYNIKIPLLIEIALFPTLKKHSANCKNIFAL